MVLTTRARICDGIIFVIYLGVAKIIVKVKIPIKSALSLTFCNADKKPFSANIGVGSDFAPKKGFNCNIINITPTAFIKPDITG